MTPTTPATIRKLLVANRGEIARRIFRTCRELGIATVAVYSDPDAGAPFVAQADEAVALGGATPAESYLRGDAIVAAALRAGADAVHPGYGFLSERADFAHACADAGLIWVGPPAAAIEAMGSKLGARALMQAAGVPVLPGVDLTGVGDAELAALGERIGWPVLIKASAGGGGRGMRIVGSPGDVVEAAASARREAAGAFGDDTVFMEKYLERPRHVEIQIFGDAAGGMVHLFERDCSVQRRHQKVIEEAPSPVLTDEQRAAMGAAAVAAGRAIGYVGAGTVEFVVGPDGDFFFLEVNTRLQVEHPVTEAITGLDLVALQIQVAEGHPLPPEAAHVEGHAIEARLYAEDPLADYLPTAGTLHHFEVPAPPGVRVDAGVESGSVVPVNYDPMLAKVIAQGATRDEAIRKLASVLRRARLHGVVTNRDLLVGVLEHPEFAEGKADTQFLERHPPRDLAGGVAGGDLDLHAIAAALVAQHRARQVAGVWREAPTGWRNNPSALQVRRYQSGERTIAVGYAAAGVTGGGWRIEVDGLEVPVEVVAVDAGGASLGVDGVVRRYDVAFDDGAGGGAAGIEARLDRIGRGAPGAGRARGDHAGWGTGAAVAWVDSPVGSVRFDAVPRFPDITHAVAAGSLLAPMPGVVTRVEVAEGDAVVRGQTLVLLEAMKMEHAVTAPSDGTVSTLSVVTGATVDAGQVLAVVDGEASTDHNGTGE